MSLKLDSFEEQLDKIRVMLPDYMAELGHDVSNTKKIKCINPEHDDGSPSMSLFEPAEGAPMLHCFSCNASYDIFTAAHVLEYKPKMGPGFVAENVMYLADKFNIKVEVRQMTEEEVYELNTYEAYNLVARYIAGTEFNELGKAELVRRGWDEEDSHKLLVGQCDDYDKMRSLLKMSGFTARFLDEVDLSNKHIFNPNNLLFTVSDEYGRPVGFAARNLKYDGVKDDNNRLIHGPKFNNTKTTGIKCNIYRKSERLYLLHEAKEHASPLIIVEGYGDALSAQLAGAKNVVAIGSLQLSEHHLNACRKAGIYDVVICLDADVEGQKKAKKLLDEVLKSIHDLRIRFIFLEEEYDEDKNPIKVDPDIFIRTHGVQAFVKLPKIDPFEWRLMEFLEDEEADAETICFNMIPIIMSEPSPIRRESMTQDLATHTGFSTKAIRDELDKIAEGLEAQIQRRKGGVIDSLKTMLEKRSDSPEIILQRGLDDLYSIDKEKNAGRLNAEAMLNGMLSIKQYEETEELHSALNFGDNFPTFNVALSGDLRGKMIVLGGSGNTGPDGQYPV